MLLTGCGSDSASDKITKKEEFSDAEISSEKTEIRLLNNKLEVDEELKELAKKYEEETGVVVTIESLGGSIDTQSTLKSYYQDGNMPDIFCIEGEQDYPTWEGNLADLSDSEWVSDTDAAYVSNGVVFGFPTTTEAIGLSYNADILRKAGVDPYKITSPKAMKAAFEKLDEKKEELGLRAVVGWFTNASDLSWSTGLHMFASYIDEGLERDDTTYIDLLNNDGGLEDKRLMDWANMIELFNEYSDPDLVSAGTYDQQVSNFAAGKYAFVTQGSWIGTLMVNDYKEAYEGAGSFGVGMAPYAFQDGQDTILTNTPNWWVVYKDGDTEASKAFLEWCADNEGGQQILVERCGFVSPYKSCTFQADDPFAGTIAEYANSEKTSSWHWLSMKEGIELNATGKIFQRFSSGSIASAEDFAAELKKAIEEYYAG
ncbi:MAG: carbohydrate ABC transporter substrate-binding protein [Lachnospiraceae bacterium]|nr:carbohydrate ABC transporter substrate-binding protein [Lachnospiraceae bacterium]